ncbi:MAG: DUF4276 family protein [Chloroflexota bacterium]|nr:DUF4276 family protein [Chloroflexota bacterium]
MKFVLMVEGWTEKERVVRGFLKRWLDPRLAQPVGINSVRFKGSSNYISNIASKAELYLASEDVVAVIGLLDLYGLPKRVQQNFARDATVDEKVSSARRQIVNLISVDIRDRFRQHFAVHEIEAWLLAEPDRLPRGIALTSYQKDHPETVDFDTPPSRLLNREWRRLFKRNYKEVTEMRNRLPTLDPDKVYQKCPHFREMMDEMLQLARVRL